MTAGIVLVGSTLFAAEARAGCIVPGGRTPAPQPGRLPVPGARPIAFADGDSRESDQSVVGMWHAVFTTSTGDPYDEVFQQFGSDGMENIISNGLPPIMGNTCIGVFKQVGTRTYKLLHTTWNWDDKNTNPVWGVPGLFAGTFLMEVVLRVSRDGKTYEGRFVARNFDPNNQQLDETTGTVRGERITVD
jgi:hypothetical protein